MKKNVMAAMVSAALAITALFGAARQYPVSAEKGISESVYSNNIMLITEIDSQEELNSLSSLKADIALFRLNDEGKILFGAETADFDGGALGEAVPAFYVTDEASAAAAASLISLQFPYAYIASDNPALVASVREDCPASSGMIDFRGRDVKATEVRNIVNSNAAKCALTSVSQFSASDVEKLRKLLITVYMETESKEAHFTALSYGVDGILSKNLSAVREALATGCKNTYAPRPYVVAHRGSSQATRGAASPYYENTVAAARAAYDGYNVDFVEIDLYLSKDGYVVISHDSTLTRMTTGTGNIESMTLAQIREYQVDGGLTDPEFLDEIAVLDDYFKEFKDDELYFLLEIKSENPECVDIALSTIKKYGMSDRVNFISFHKAQLSRVRALEPAISVSYLTNGGEYSVGEEDFEKNVLDVIVPLNASLSPNWESMNADGVRRLARYGVKVNAWTMNMEAVFFRELKNIGYATYTTDFCGWLEKHPYKIVLQTTEIEVVPEEEFSISAKLVRWDGTEEKNAVFTLVPITDGFELSEHNGKFAAKTEGQGKYLLFYEGRQFSLVSRPIMVTAGRKAENGGKTEGNSGCGSLVNGKTTILLLVAVGMIVSSARRKRN